MGFSVIKNILSYFFFGIHFYYSNGNNCASPFAKQHTTIEIAGFTMARPSHCSAPESHTDHSMLFFLHESSREKGITLSVYS
jgi:hypothetical protein